MPDNGYRYDVDQCDVPKDRRSALIRFRDKRREWTSWLETDEHHAIWQALHAMVWTDVAFNALRGFAEDDENALNNPLIVEALLKGHLATQVLAIRRLMEDSPKSASRCAGWLRTLSVTAPFSREKTTSVTTVCLTTTKPFATLCSVSLRKKRRIQSPLCGEPPKVPRLAGCRS
jgi:hypothetical protein